VATQRDERVFTLSRQRPNTTRAEHTQNTTAGQAWYFSRVTEATPTLVFAG